MDLERRAAPWSETLGRRDYWNKTLEWRVVFRRVTARRSVRVPFGVLCSWKAGERLCSGGQCASHKISRAVGINRDLAMEVPPILNIFLFTGMFLVISSNLAEAVECYICSWNPSDYKNGGGGGGGNNNQHDYTDVCSAGHFDPERVRTHDCSKGCEIVSMRNPNGVLEMYYRNCVTNQQITYAYIKKSSKLNDEEVYTCDYDLCNTADTGRHLHLFVLTVPMLVLPIHLLFM